jgi:uncharacterized protein YjbI with pentapeptide repeats
VDVLKQGVAEWNAWRGAHPDIVPDLSEVRLVRADLTGINFSKTNLNGSALDGATLIDADLSDSSLTEATLLRTNLRRADLRRAKFSLARAFSANFISTRAQGAQFDGALLWFADFTDAQCAGASFRDAGLRATWFQRTDLSNADLTYASFVKTHMDDAILDNCQVYGASIWDLQGVAARQTNLIITVEGEPVIAVDDLKIAQFIRLLLTHSEIRDVIETIGRKAVLILGRFSPERKPILDATRAALRHHNYVPLMFDFDKPNDRSRIETVQTLAHLSRFVIADLTDAKVLLQELQAIVPQLGSLPILPMLQAGSDVNVVIADFAARSNFITEVFEYTDIQQIESQLATSVIAPAEARRDALAAAEAAFAAKFSKAPALPPQHA